MATRKEKLDGNTASVKILERYAQKRHRVFINLKIN